MVEHFFLETAGSSLPAMIVGPVGLLVLVAFGFHRASEASAEVQSLAYPFLAMVGIAGLVMLLVGGVEAKQYCDELWESSGQSTIDYNAAHCSTLWPKPSY